MSISRVVDLARSIRAVYEAIANVEGIPAPTLQFSRRYVEQIHAPNRIVLVPGDVEAGEAGSAIRVSAGYVGGVITKLDAHIWGPEPVIAEDATDEFEIELARVEALDPMVDRYINVVKALAPGSSEGVSITVNPKGGRLLMYGELAIVRYEYTRGVEQQRIFRRINLATLSPRDVDRPNGDSGKVITVSTSLNSSR